MDIKAPKPNTSGLDTNESIDALYAYIQNISTELNMSISKMKKRINLVTEEIKSLKGENQ